MELFQGNRNVRPVRHDGPVAVLHGLLRPEECAAIVGMMGELPAHEATVDNREREEATRRSDVRWLKHDDPHPARRQATQFLLGVMAQANQDFFGFELTDLEPIQLTHYREEVKGTYDWHQDGFFHGDNNLVRKLSMVIQLSPPEDYDGGGLELQVSKIHTVVPAELGLAVLFPAPTMHRVVPVTLGSRRSLVAWARGPNFR